MGIGTGCENASGANAQHTPPTTKTIFSTHLLHGKVATAYPHCFVGLLFGSLKIDLNGVLIHRRLPIRRRSIDDENRKNPLLFSRAKHLFTRSPQSN